MSAEHVAGVLWKAGDAAGPGELVDAPLGAFLRGESTQGAVFDGADGVGTVEGGEGDAP